LRYTWTRIILLMTTMLVCMIALEGCSALIARNTAQDPRIIRKGAQRFDIEKKLGKPEKIERLSTGEILVSYSLDPRGRDEQEAKSAATGHTLLSISTIGLWELVATPMELAKWAAQNKSVIYYIKYSQNNVVTDFWTKFKEDEQSLQAAQDFHKTDPIKQVDRTADTSTRLGAVTEKSGQSIPAKVLAPSLPRYALVIGNGAYRTMPKLRNPANDARAIADALQRLSFEVTLLEDATRDQMARAILAHSRKLSQGGEGVLFYAGHGMQVRGNNYLFPIEANATTENEVDVVTISLNWVMQTLADSRNNANVLILDACRDNPLQIAFRSSTRGLAIVGKTSTNTLILYATAPDSVAIDGSGQNSVFTSEILRHIEIPNMKVEDLFKKVIVGVRQKTDGVQIPWMTGNLEGDFVFCLEHSKIKGDQ